MNKYTRNNVFTYIKLTFNWILLLIDFFFVVVVVLFCIFLIWIFKRCLMNQNFCWTVVSLQSLDGQRTAYLNILMFMLDILREIFHINMDGQLTTRTTVSGIHFQYSQKWSGFPAKLIRFHCPLGFCLSRCMILLMGGKVC